MQLSNTNCRDRGCTRSFVKQWRAYPLCSGYAEKGFKPLSVSSTKGQSAQRARGQTRSLPAGAKVDPAEFALTADGEEIDSGVSSVQSCWSRRQPCVSELFDLSRHTTVGRLGCLADCLSQRCQPAVLLPLVLAALWCQRRSAAAHIISYAHVPQVKCKLLVICP